jgi:DNA-binding HxlR family transcriptional regulator
MRDALFFGGGRFADFSRSGEHIPTNILSARLKKLVEIGLLEKTPYQDNPVRYQYQPSAAGRELRSILRSMVAFGEKHLGGTVPKQSVPQQGNKKKG